MAAGRSSGRAGLARLLVTGGTGNDAAAEVAHEVLLRDWQRLSRWVEAERTFLVWKAELEGDRREWHRTGKDEGTLLRGARLVEAEAWLARRGNDVLLDDQEFAKASVRAREREQATQIRRRRWTIAGCLAAVAVMAVLTIVVLRQRNLAETQLLVAEEQRRIAEIERSRSERLLRRANVLVSQFAETNDRIRKIGLVINQSRMVLANQIGDILNKDISPTVQKEARRTTGD